MQVPFSLSATITQQRTTTTPGDHLGDRRPPLFRDFALGHLLRSVRDVVIYTHTHKLSQAFTHLTITAITPQYYTQAPTNSASPQG
jgi:hypothetical protein